MNASEKLVQIWSFVFIFSSARLFLLLLFFQTAVINYKKPIQREHGSMASSACRQWFSFLHDFQFPMDPAKKVKVFLLSVLAVLHVKMLISRMSVSLRLHAETPPKILQSFKAQSLQGLSPKHIKQPKMVPRKQGP